jgi:hypothetical protein
MQRYRASNDPVPVPALMDDLVYDYAMVGHRLTSVQDNSSMASSMFFPQFINNASAMMEYYYDELGNCVEDWNKKLSYEYNDIGLLNKATHYDYPDPVQLPRNLFNRLKHFQTQCCQPARPRKSYCGSYRRRNRSKRAKLVRQQR